MLFPWFRHALSQLPSRKARRSPAPRRLRPAVELLEVRTVPSTLGADFNRYALTPGLCIPPHCVPPPPPDLPLTPGTGASIHVHENDTFRDVVATFRDGDPKGNSAQFTATIDWGDGTGTPVGRNDITGSPALFTVRGGHRYTQTGNYTVLVHVVDAGGSTTDVRGTVAVADAPLRLGTTTSVDASRGVPYTAELLTFTDDDTGMPAQGNFTATITWGDGTTSRGTVVAHGTAFGVRGSHVYDREGTFPVSVTVRDAAGSQVVGNLSAVVPDVLLTPATGASINVHENDTFSAVVATFRDGDANATAAQFTAGTTIDWGDGTVTHVGLSDITGSPALFTVRGTHRYTQAGKDTVTVHVLDAGGSTTNVPGTALVVDAPLTVTGATITATANVPFSGVVGLLTDANLSAPAADFTVTIAWGDGHTSAGTLVPLGNGQFQVTGSNTYATPTCYAIRISVRDADGSSASADAVANVDGGPVSLPGPPVGIHRGRVKRRGRHYQQTVTLINPGDTAAAGPISLVLDGLGRRVRLRNASGFTAAGSPYVNAPGSLAPGAAVNLMLQFFSPTARIRYGTRVVVGPGPR
jgi:hypothetical protein